MSLTINVFSFTKVNHAKSNTKKHLNLKVCTKVKNKSVFGWGAFKFCTFCSAFFLYSLMQIFFFLDLETASH